MLERFDVRSHPVRLYVDGEEVGRRSLDEDDVERGDDGARLVEPATTVTFDDPAVAATAYAAVRYPAPTAGEIHSLDD